MKLYRVSILSNLYSLPISSLFFVQYLVHIEATFSDLVVIYTYAQRWHKYLVYKYKYLVASTSTST